VKGLTKKPMTKEANGLKKPMTKEANGLKKPMTKEANGLKKPMTNKPMTKEVPEKKLIGTVYQCVKCGADYNAKTVWQKNCPICTAKVKSEVLKRKKKVS
jgi:rubrerythrin